MRTITIELVYATKTEQKSYSFVVAESMTVGEAIKQSGVLTDFPEIDLEKQSVGVYSKRVELTDFLNECDRIEIYRPLAIDPKDARRLRAEEKRKKLGLTSFGA